jgi:hypothetical protein
VQTVESAASSSVSPSLSLPEPRFESPAEAPGPATPVANPTTRAFTAATKTTTPVPATPPKAAGATSHTGPASGGRPSGLKNSRVRALAAESENLPSPKQPKSPAPALGTPGTPVNPFGSGGTGEGHVAAAAGALSPCDSPTLPSAVLGRSGPGAFTRRVFRSHSNQAMT